jgi:hypothetical protein
MLVSIVSGMRTWWLSPLKFLNLGGLSAEGSQRLQTREAALSKVCGCSFGALCALAALGWVLLTSHHPPSVLRAVLAGAAWVFGAAILGKFIALLAARLILIVRACILLKRQSIAGLHS